MTNNRLFAINEEELLNCPNRISALTDILNNIDLERNDISNAYDLFKATVSSIYGCCGKMIPVVAAGITCKTREALLASAQYCRSVGRNILYMDTDSIMTTGGFNDLSAELNNRFPHMEMEMKVASKCMFVQRKTYYKYEKGELKYGQNVNGPIAWRECVLYFYANQAISTNEDIYNAFLNFFMKCYAKLTSYTTVCDEFKNLIKQTIKTKSEYVTATVPAKFKAYLAKHYPEIAGSNKHEVYYHLENGVTFPCFRPLIDLQSVGDLKYVNLFKYYQNMFTTLFNIIKFHVRRNNEPFNVTISSKYVRILMLKAFLVAYENTFGNADLCTVGEQQLPGNIIDVDSASIDNPSYSEPLEDNNELNL